MAYNYRNLFLENWSILSKIETQRHADYLAISQGYFFPLRKDSRLRTKWPKIKHVCENTKKFW